MMTLFHNCLFCYFQEYQTLTFLENLVVSSGWPISILFSYTTYCLLLLLRLAWQRNSRPPWGKPCTRRLCKPLQVTLFLSLHRCRTPDTLTELSSIYLAAVILCWKSVTYYAGGHFYTPNVDYKGWILRSTIIDMHVSLTTRALLSEMSMHLV